MIDTSIPVIAYVLVGVTSAVLAYVTIADTGSTKSTTGSITNTVESKPEPSPVPAEAVAIPNVPVAEVAKVEPETELKKESEPVVKETNTNPVSGGKMKKNKKSNNKKTKSNNKKNSTKNNKGTKNKTKRSNK